MKQAIEILKREAGIRLQDAEHCAKAPNLTIEQRERLIDQFTEQGSAIMYAVGILRDSID